MLEQSWATLWALLFLVSNLLWGVFVCGVDRLRRWERAGRIAAEREVEHG